MAFQRSTFMFSGGAALAVALTFAATQPTMADGENWIECASIDDNGERLACYDAAVAFASPASSKVEAIDAPELTTRATASKETPSFGEEDLAARESAKRAASDESLQGMAVAITQDANGRYTIRLDNGQVWKQIRGDSGRLRKVSPGNLPMSAEIRRKSLGSYSLTLGSSNRSIRVERLQ